MMSVGQAKARGLGCVRGIIVATLVAVVLWLVVLGTASAFAHHALTRAEARAEFRSYAFEHYDVDYFDRGPSCYRFSRYLFRCVAVVVYFDGDTDCIRGPVRAVGPIHHGVVVRQWLCRG
jgi:hypothetical protein